MEEIRRMGDARYVDGEEILFLKNISLAYERLHPTDDGDPYVEDVGLKIPLASIAPVTSLKIRDAEVAFSAEVAVQDADGAGGQVMARPRRISRRPAP